MTETELRLLLGVWVKPETDGLPREIEMSRGSTYQRERLQMLAERCCRDYEGDLVEIGCLNGSTTFLLAQVAQLYHRRVIAIDPWEIGTQNCNGGEYENFLHTTAPYSDLIDVLRYDSREHVVMKYLRDRKLCFSFIDGLHEHGAAENDIRITQHAALIVVDDCTWNAGVRQAWADGAAHRLHISVEPFKENYIL